MQNALSRFFYNEKTMRVIPWVYIISAMLFGYVSMKLDENFMTADFAVIMLTAIVILFIAAAYKMHEKNIMKGLVGAVLMQCLVTALRYVVSYCDAGTSAIDIVLSIFYFVCYFVFFVCHFILAGDHSARPTTVKVNQTVAVLIVLIVILWNGLVFGFGSVGAAVLVITSLLYEAALLGVIICIEIRVDAFKLARDERNKTSK